MIRPIVPGATPDSALTLDDFDYPFPEHLVAQTPLARREDARLMVRAPSGTLTDTRIADLTTVLPRGTLLILNDTRVFPSRMLGRLPSGGQVELFLIAPATDGDPETSVWEALGRPMRKLREGTCVDFSADLRGIVEAKWSLADGTARVRIRFDRGGDSLQTWLATYGYVPLPPYIKREKPLPASRSSDVERYQTVFADSVGSVAAPTAGLHFSEALLASLGEAGIQTAKVTLHVGGGTFLPVRTKRPEDHVMHREVCRVGAETFAAIRRARADGRPVIAVGTTAFRCLEDLARSRGGDLAEGTTEAASWRETQLFIYPKVAADRYRPYWIDGLLTNFHQPKSTLFMLVSALIGIDAAKSAYADAISKEYRLYSYGDACLFWF